MVWCKKFSRSKWECFEDVDDLCGLSSGDPEEVFSAIITPLESQIAGLGFVIFWGGILAIIWFKTENGPFQVKPLLSDEVKISLKEKLKEVKEESNEERKERLKELRREYNAKKAGVFLENFGIERDH